MDHSVHRRSVLAGAGAVALASCLGLGDTSDEINELESQLDQQNATIQEFEDQLDDLEARERDLEEDVDDLEAEREQLIEDRLTLLYDRAAVFHDLAEQEYDNAVDRRNEENWAWAARWFAMAFRSYDAATELTFQAGVLARDEGYDDAESVAETSNTYARLMRDACDYFAIAAGYYANEQWTQGDDAVDEGNAAYEDAQQYSFSSVVAFEGSF